MANREKVERKTGTSLLWEPPKSSDSLGSVLLMPAVASASHVSGEGADTFASEKLSDVSEAYSYHSSFPAASTCETASVSRSQLNQPLRVRQSSPSYSPLVSSSAPTNEAARISHGNSPMSSTTRHTVPSSPAVLSAAPPAEVSTMTGSSSFTGQIQAPGYSREPVGPFAPMQSTSSMQNVTLPPYNDSYYPSENTNQSAYQGPMSSENTSSYAYQESNNVYSMVGSPPQTFYTPVEGHWFYRKVIERRDVWLPFSKIDSVNLEDAYRNSAGSLVVPTDGGRYDVIVNERFKKAVYWDEEPLSVRRCTWFYKSDGPQRYSPYEEEIADKLEDYYHICSTANKWGQRLELTVNEIVVMQSPQVIIHYIPSNQADDWTTVADHKFKQRVVKRGLDEMMIVEDGESMKVDHLVFVIHGIGSVCDLRFRTIAECVDGFREIANNLIKTHFITAFDSGRIGRVEFLPVSWHSALHTDDKGGVDRRMKCITLPSIPKLRHFTNDTLLDILYYSSPVYCQTILDSVGYQLNDLYQMFSARNPQFNGNVSVAGHSLGSLILFDILANHTPPTEENLVPDTEPTTQDIPEVYNELDGPDVTTTTEQLETLPDVEGKSAIVALLEQLNLQEYVDLFLKEKIDIEVLKTLDEEDIRNLGLPMGPRKKILSHIKCLNESSIKRDLKNATVSELEFVNNADPWLNKESAYDGSILGVVREDSHSSLCTETVTSQYPKSLQKNIYSPIKYPRLVFSPACFFALGSPISMFLTIRGFNSISEDYQLPTCASFFNIFHPYDPVAFRIETLIDPNFTAKPVLIPHHKGRKRLHIELKEGLSRMGFDLKQKLMDSLKYTWNSISDFAKAHTFPADSVEAEVDKFVQEQMSNAYETESTVSAADGCRDEDIQIGQLNGGRRVDFVLQEKPIESLNEYLFALTSHATYWDSEDTVLMILKEVYALENVFPSAPRKDSGKIHLYNPSLAPVSSTMFSMSPSTSANILPLQNLFTSGLSSQLNAASLGQQTQPSGATQITSPQQVSNISSLQQVSHQPPPIAPAQPIGPPPLTGFVNRSALAKH